MRKKEFFETFLKRPVKVGLAVKHDEGFALFNNSRPV
jgi:hypothetical protein